MSPNQITRTDLFSALGDANRRRILELLATSDRAVGQLAAGLGITQPSVTQHLAVLREVGLVDSTRDGTRHVYRLLRAPLGEVTDWIQRL
jgi:DNA-binding transcriptional ArsR family regulator